ncbi:hypothetical protein F5Y15DRAFT_413563 [Xylariaceae sp. FL0016]|nr:hypothetical protein F5Y15DRAFT_413563 [Xylariaceae sp. FL0016]
MPSASVKNPNRLSRNRMVANAAKARKAAAKSSSLSGKSKVQKSDDRRGARTGILPTSGPNAALSSKKRRKLEKKMGYAMKRKMAAEGEVEMKDVEDGAVEKGKETQGQAGEDENMAVDAEIS